MKKIIIFSFLVIVSIFSFQKENLKAECPFGSNSGSISYLDVMGCPWTITFCWSCQHIGTKPTMWASNIKYSAAATSQCSGSTPPLDEVQDAILAWIADQGCEGEPCNPNTERDTGYIDMPMCQKWTNTVYPSNNVTWMTSCETNLVCRKKFTYCVDYNHTPPVLDIVYTTTELIGDINACSDIKPILPPPGKTYQENWETNCYKEFPCLNP